MLRLLLFLSASLHMLDFTCLDNLFAYKMPMHRKYVRLRCVCHMFHDALFFSIIIFRVSIVEILCLARGVKRQRLLGGNPILFLFLAFCSCLIINNSYSLCLDVVLCFNQCLCQVEPLGRLGESLRDLAVKNRNFSAHENCYHFYLESAIQLIIFTDD